MIIDTSAVIAILQNEPEAASLLAALAADASRQMSTASYLEASIVIGDRRGPAGVVELDHLLSRAGVEFVPVDINQARLARDAFARYGKGRHPATLNFGDCFTYALAKAVEEPILFKGNDFCQTDIDCISLDDLP